MNILERKERLEQHVDIINLGGKYIQNRQKNIAPMLYWNQLQAPPIRSYIPDSVQVYLYNLMTSVRLMNHPAKRYKLMNEALVPYRFFPLASGTNRRAFYCDYDPKILLKVASDSVGQNINYREFHILQNIAKPFCPKIFELGYQSVCILSEQVEEMTEEGYKKQWASEIFDLMYTLLQRGYIAEDIGSNFFKNFGVRLGFGPVIIDFGDIYKIDWKKLKCKRQNLLTGEICNGEIDYDYDKGMSEIVCTKCGTRYSAKYLADEDVFKESRLVKGVNYMSRINKNIKVSIVGNDGKVIGHSFNEIPVQLKTNTRRVLSDQEVLEQQRAQARMFNQYPGFNPQTPIVTSNGMVAVPSEVAQKIRQSMHLEATDITPYQGNDRPKFLQSEKGPQAVPDYYAKRLAKREVEVEIPSTPTRPVLTMKDPNKDLTSSQKLISLTDEQVVQILNAEKKGHKSFHEAKSWEYYEEKGEYYILYPAEIKKPILTFLIGLEKNFGFNIANIFAKKLEFKYISYTKHKGRDKQGFSEKPSSIRKPVVPKVQISAPQQQQVVPQPESISVSQTPIITTSDQSMLTGQVMKNINNWKSRNSTESTVVSPTAKSVQPTDNNDAPAIATQVAQNWTEQINDGSCHVQIKEKITIKQDPVKTNAESDNQVQPEHPDWVPNNGLFPMKALSAEEIYKKELAERNEKSVMGFPGTPLIDTLRQESELPKVKVMVEQRYGNFVRTANPDDMISSLCSNIKDFIKEDIMRIMKDDGQGLVVSGKMDVDHLSKEFAHIFVENYKSHLFDVALYPETDKSTEEEFDEPTDEQLQQLQKFMNEGEEPNKENDKQEEKSLDTSKINIDLDDKEFLKEYFDKLVENFNETKISECADVEEAKSKLNAFLFARLYDDLGNGGGVTVPKLHNIITQYINENCNFSV